MLPTKYHPDAQPVIDRLAALDYSKSVFDRPRIEVAINRHLTALGQPLRPIEWFEDAWSGYSAARAAAWAAAWDAARDAASAAAWDAARDAASAAARAAARAAAWDAARAAAMLGTGLVGKNDAVTKAHGIWVPFVEATEAGLFLFWITPTRVICVPHPVMHMNGATLHRASGPAVHWPTGEEYYFLNGVLVTKSLVMTPAEELNPTLLLKEQNAEVRREIVRKIGIERVCAKLGAECVDKRDGYELLLLDLGDGRKRPYLKMRNPSIGVYHIEGVDPSIRTVNKALEWRNQSEDAPEVLT